MIRTIGLSKSFGNQVLFTDLNITLPEHKVTTIMGISGKGKTTLLRILAGLDKQYGGSVEGIPQKVAWVFQEDRLLPWLNLYDNLVLVLPKGEDTFNKVMEVLKLVGLESDKYKMVQKLSGGMQRRAALARGLLAEADYMFLDEPFSGLDEKTKLQVAKRVFERAKAQGQTVIVVTHDKEIAALGDNIISLDA